MVMVSGKIQRVGNTYCIAYVYIKDGAVVTKKVFGRAKPVHVEPKKVEPKKKIELEIPAFMRKPLMPLI